MVECIVNRQAKNVYIYHGNNFSQAKLVPLTVGYRPTSNRFHCPYHPASNRLQAIDHPLYACRRLSPKIIPRFMMLLWLVEMQWADIDFHGRFTTIRRNFSLGKIETPKNGS